MVHCSVLHRVHCIVQAAHKGIPTDAVLVNYTKHCLAFRNHVRVHPFTKEGVLEGFKVSASPPPD